MAVTNRTTEQTQVILHRGGDLLVSASAGSGKTTVLIEHVMNLILDPERPVELDRLLIATFTNAAAEEMRDRLAAAIDARIKEEPQRAAYLRRQRLLLPHAHISTLDAFFGWMVRNHYQDLDIDPDFRIGDEGELKLLQMDVAEALFEQRYQQEDRGFFALVDAYGGDKTDADLKDQLIRLHHFAQSAPDPEGWLEESVAGVEAGLHDPVILDFVTAKKQEFRSMTESIRLAEASLAGTDSKVLTTLAADAMLLQGLINTTDIPAFFRELNDSKFVRLSAPREANRTPEEKAAIDLRNTIKKKVDDFRKKYGMAAPELVNELAPAVAVPMRAFVDLALDFGREYRQAKQEKNILDFADVSHLALRLLVEKSHIAKELRDSFQEIIIDEFQDINRLQEEILALLSGTEEGRYDRFMVGDVKQSIYGFRMAEPDIFQNKYDAFSPEEGALQRRIDLNANFRSRREVLEAVNAVFVRVMTPASGRVDYQKNAMLICGAKNYEEAPDGRYQAELLLLEEDKEREDDPEILAIAQRILELTDPEKGLMIYDKKEKRTRRAQYRDVVILARSVSSLSADYVAALGEEGIPAVADKKTGFFNAPEIQLLCNMLRVIDNPRQDVPLMAVLTSPMFGLGEDLLLNLRLDHWSREKRGTLKDTLYDACLAGEDSKVRSFLTMLGQFQHYAGYHSIHELISLILEETGYLYYAMALPDGGLRKANIEMLLERAIDFEATSYSGIFQFNRYLEQLKKYEIDYGEADVISEQDDVVRILSVHQSKGLEYPIVFLANTDHGYNLQDARKAIPHHPDYGIRADLMDRDKNMKITTLARGALGAFLERRSREEELRILYVAMTRAREKLIISGIKKVTKKEEEEGPSLEALFAQGTPLPSWLVFSVPNDLALIRLALGEGHSAFAIRHLSPEERQADQERRIRTIREDRRAMEALDPEQVYDPELKQQLQALEDFAYPYEGATINRRVYAVSDLKKKGKDREVVIRAEGDEGAAEAAKRGTAYHLLMSKVDPERGTEILHIKEVLTRLMKQGQIDPDIGAELHPEWIRGFYASSLGGRVLEAHREGRLYREKPFILGKNAAEMDPTNSPDDMVMIKGVMDCFFLEEGGMVLVDYKTDRVRPGEEQVLADRYRDQLAYYAAALENAFKRPVKEKLLYSFVLGKEIEVRT